MRLYIHTVLNKQDQVKEVHNIKLQDGYIPSIGRGTDHASIKKSPFDPEFTPGVIKKNSTKNALSTTWHCPLIPLEPAVWFKVKVVDVIVIDCKNKCVKWQRVTDDNTEDNLINSLDAEDASPEHNFRGLSLALSNGNCCYETDLDQLITSCESLMKDYIRGLIDNQRFNETVLKLLHFQVLPIIALFEEDIPKLQEICEEQKEHIVKVEHLIIARNQKLEEVLRAIQNQCDQYVKELQSGQSKKNFPSDFAKILKEDLDKSIKQVKYNIEDLEKDISKIKTSSSGEMLIEKSTLRNEAKVTYNNMLKAKEYLEQQLASHPKSSGFSLLFRSSPRARNKNPLHNIYIAMNEKRKEILQDILLLSQRKVLLLSVREAIHSTIGEIKADKVSFGIDSDACGRKATDVLRNSLVPIDWKPMSEQVYSAITDEETTIGRDHNQMIRNVIDQCIQVCYEVTLQESAADEKDLERHFEESMSHLLQGHPNETVQHVPRNSIDNVSLLQSDGTVDSTQLVFVYKPHFNYFKQRTESLKQEIIGHFECICKQLQSMLGHHSKLAHKKLWLLYEPHFFKNTMKYLQKLYNKAYSESCKQLKLFIQQLTVDDLQLEHMFILHILEDKNGAQESEKGETQERESFASTSDRSTGSFGSPESGACLSPLRRPRNRMSCIATNADRSSRDITICYPVNLTYINRTTWPLPEFAENEDSGCDSPPERFSARDSDSSTLVNDSLNSSFHTKSVILKAKYQELFKGPLSCIHALVKKDTPMTKLHCLTNCLKKLTETVSEIKMEESGSQELTGTDDLIDMLVILICNCDLDVLTLVYVDLMLLADLAAPFLENGPHNYSLVNFMVAFKFVQDRMLVLRRRNQQSVDEDTTVENSSDV